MERVDGAWVCHRDPADEGLTDDWVVSRDFEEVDAAGLRESLWHTVCWGRWLFNEEILVLEARACEKAVQRLACGAFGTNVRQLILLDNMSLVLCLSRGRSRNFEVLVLCRATLANRYPADNEIKYLKKFPGVVFGKYKCSGHGFGKYKYPGEMDEAV